MMSHTNMDLNASMIMPSNDDLFANSQSPVVKCHPNYDALKAEIISELTKVFNKRVEFYFNKDFPPGLETIVNAKLNRMARDDQSDQNDQSKFSWGLSF